MPKKVIQDSFFLWKWTLEQFFSPFFGNRYLKTDNFSRFWIIILLKILPQCKYLVICPDKRLTSVKNGKKVVTNCDSWVKCKLEIQVWIAPALVQMYEVPQLLTEWSKFQKTKFCLKRWFSTRFIESGLRPDELM